MRPTFRFASWLALAAAGLVTSSASAGVYRTITVDGDVSDWNGIAPVLTDPQDNTTANGSGEVVDFKNLYIANDANYVYFRITLYQPANPSTYFTDILINGDNNTATGFGKAGQGYAADYGSEMLIESNGVFQEAGGGFNEGTIGVKDSGTDSIEYQAQKYNVDGTDGFEYRVSRNSLLQYTGNDGVNYAGKKVFSGNSFAMTLVTSPGPADVAGPVSYTFAAVPEPTCLGLAGVGLLGLARRRR